MPHVFEPAASGRAKCRGCGQPIARAELRFGERIENPFGDGAWPSTARGATQKVATYNRELH